MTLQTEFVDLVDALAYHKKISKKDVIDDIICPTAYVSPHTVESWIRNRRKINLDEDILLRLAQYGIEDGDLKRAWAKGFLKNNRVRMERILPFLSEYFPDPIPNNLPKPQAFFGREEELRTIQRRFKKGKEWFIQIAGMGGVGKTALAIAAGWQAAENYGYGKHHPPMFDAVVWTSAKREKFHNGIHPNNELFRLYELDDIHRAIWYVLKKSYSIMKLPAQERSRVVREALEKAGKVLIILDNLEEVQNEQWVIDLLSADSDYLPLNTKVIVTGRYFETFRDPINLTGLEYSAAEKLIMFEGQSHGHHISAQHAKEIFEFTQGLPLAVSWSVGLASEDKDRISIADRLLRQPQNDILSFLFDSYMNLFQSRPNAYYVLLSMIFFDPKFGATASSLASTAGIIVSECQEEIDYLCNRNLLIKQPIEGDSPRYVIHSMTNRFLENKLQGEHQWERQARLRWEKWYISFIETNATKSPPIEEWNLFEKIVAVGGAKHQKLEKEIGNIFQLIQWYQQNDSIESMSLIYRNLALFLISDAVEGFWDVALEVGEMIADWAYKNSKYELFTWCVIIFNRIYRFQGKFSNALDWLKRAKNASVLANTERQRSIMAAILYNEAKLDLSQGSIAIGREKLREALDISTSMNNKLAVAKCLCRLANSCLLSEEYPQAQSLLQESEGICYSIEVKTPDVLDTIAVVKKSKAILSIFREEYAFARQELYKLEGDFEWKTDKIELLVAQAVVEQRIGNDLQAQDISCKAGQLADQIGLKRLNSAIYVEWEKLHTGGHVCSIATPKNLEKCTNCFFFRLNQVPSTELSLHDNKNPQRI